MRYLVTGGAGFIGSNLVKTLLEQGHRVVVVDNLSTGSVDNLPESGDIEVWLERNLPVLEGRFDGIFHLGIPSSPYLYRDDRKYCKIALNDWIDILEFAKVEGIKVIYASTSSIYNGNELPWDESMYIQVKDFYTEVRYAMERLGELYYDFYKVRNIGLRLFGVFGEGEESKKNFANVVTQMIWAKRKGDVFTIWGDGEQSRDLIYVKDVVRAFIKAMNSRVECDIFNVGNGEEWTLNDMASVVGCRVEHTANPMQNYVDRTLAYLGKAQRHLGFQAHYKVEDEIRRLAND